MLKTHLIIFISICLSVSHLHAQTDTTLTFGPDLTIHAIYHVAETEQPLVVLQSGARSHSGAWNALIPMLAEAGYSYLAYDRPGLGESPSIDINRSGANIAMELRRVLNRLKIEKEMILVGHSMGGVYQAIYNDFYPKNIKGLIMIDSPNGNWENGLRACLTAEQNASRDSSLQVMRAGLSAAVRGEYEGANASFETLDEVKRIGNLIVISGGAQTWPQDYDGECLNQAWQNVQKSVLSISKKSTQLISTSSGHGIPYQDPQIVMRAIKLIK